MEGKAPSLTGVWIVRRSNLDCKRARYLSRAAAIHNGIVADQIAGHAERVVQTALDFVQHHLVSPAHKDCHSLGVGAVLNDQHAVLGGAECQLPHNSSPVKHITKSQDS